MAGRLRTGTCLYVSSWFNLAFMSCVQFATELPVAGSSFTYVLASLGQFPAFLVTANMVSMAQNLRLLALLITRNRPH